MLPSSSYSRRWPVLGRGRKTNSDWILRCLSKGPALAIKSSWPLDLTHALPDLADDPLFQSLRKPMWADRTPFLIGKRATWTTQAFNYAQTRRERETRLPVAILR